MPNCNSNNNLKDNNNMSKKKQVEDYKIHIDVDKLEWWLSTDVDKIFDKYTDGSLIDTHRFIYRKAPSPAKILVVAHLDTVQPLSGIVKREGALIHASGMDDRLGAYIAWDWMKDNGINADVLLTDHEESGMSTAEFFGLADTYNWIVEFDREGQDAVTYGLDSEDWLDTLRECQFPISLGAFSDICFLETHLCCVNIGNGMRRSHSMNSYADLRDTQANLKRFCYLYDNFKDQQFYQRQNNTQATLLERQGEDRSHLGGGDGWPDGGSIDEWEDNSTSGGVTYDLPFDPTQDGDPEKQKGTWWRDIEGGYHCSKKVEDVKGDLVLCMDCNAPAFPSEMGNLCPACYNHYHDMYGTAEDEV